MSLVGKGKRPARLDIQGFGRNRYTCWTPHWVLYDSRMFERWRLAGNPTYSENLFSQVREEYYGLSFGKHCDWPECFAIFMHRPGLSRLFFFFGRTTQGASFISILIRTYLAPMKLFEKKEESPKSLAMSSSISATARFLWNWFIIV